jgi:hypothetical protein
VIDDDDFFTGAQRLKGTPKAQSIIGRMQQGCDGRHEIRNKQNAEQQ